MNETDSLFLPIGNKRGEIPKEIQLLPPGPHIAGRDGRHWIVLNATSVAEASNKEIPYHPIDENHAIDRLAPQGLESPAFGWFENVRVKEDGSLWADVSWTEKGEKAVSGLEYRYISPAIVSNDKKEISAILRAALTNSPNLPIQSLNSEHPESPEKENNMKQILEALGLPETATEEDVVAAIKKLQEQKALNSSTNASVDLAVYATRADLNMMEERAKAAEAKLLELNNAQFKEKKERVIDEAIKQRKIAPASRTSYLDLCSTEDDLKKIKEIIDKNPEVVEGNPQAPGGTPPASGSGGELSDEEKALAKAAGYSDEEWKKLKEAEKK